MDGTLVDTEPYWIEAEFDLADKYGGTWSREHAMNLVGHDLLDSGRYIREHMGIDLEPSVIVEELLDRVIEHIGREVPVASRGRGAAGGPEPARRARARWSRCPTSGSWRRSSPRSRRARSDAWSPATRCAQGKPHPEPYLKAARNLGVRARRLPGHRGLQHRRPVRRGGGLHRARRTQPRAGAAGGAARLPRLAGADVTRSSGRAVATLGAVGPNRCLIATLSGGSFAGLARRPPSKFRHRLAP